MTITSTNLVHQLNAAACGGDVEKIKELLAVAPPHIDILYSLTNAAVHQNKECVNLLLPYATPKQRQLALKVVAKNANIDMTKLLVIQNPTTQEDRAFNSEGLKAVLRCASPTYAKFFNEVIMFLLPISDVKTVLVDQKKDLGITPTVNVTIWPLDMLQTWVDKMEHREKADAYVKSFGKNTPNEALLEAALQRNSQAIEVLLPYTKNLKARVTALNTAATLGDAQSVRNLFFGRLSTDIMGTQKLNFNKDALKRTLINAPDLSGELDTERLMCANILAYENDVKGALSELSVLYPNRSWSFLQKILDDEAPLLNTIEEDGRPYTDRSDYAVQRAKRVDKLEQKMSQAIPELDNSPRHPTVPNHVFSNIDTAMQALSRPKRP